MRGDTLLILGCGPITADSPQVQRAMELLAQAAPPPSAQARFATIDDLIADESLAEGVSLGWIMLPQEMDGPAFEAMGILQDRHLPALLTRCPEKLPLGAAVQEGITAAPADADPTAMMAVLRALLNTRSITRGLETELRILRAHQGGLADTFGKIDEELRLAAQLQREFLPRTFPQVKHLECRVLFRPAGYVSGDIYDVMRLDESHVGFFIADAVGHGVPAALMTMFIKRSLVTKETGPNILGGYRIIPPAEALAQLNRDMIEQQSGGRCRFATACYGILNTGDLSFSFARAGHPFPLILHRDGSTTALEPDGGLLGVFAEETFEQRTYQLAPGERLLLFSDGFELAFPKPDAADQNAAEVSPDAYYTDYLKQLATGPLEPAMQRLADLLDTQAGSLNQRDDLTALVLAIDPDAGVVAEPASSQAQPRERAA
jgi:sigma-B regulation protein RsbU (phosphoserine phosphatase)